MPTLDNGQVRVELEHRVAFDRAVLATVATYVLLSVALYRPAKAD